MKQITLTESQMKSLLYALQDVVDIYEDTDPDDECTYEFNQMVAKDLRDVLQQLDVEACRKVIY